MGRSKYYNGLPLRVWTDADCETMKREYSKGHNEKLAGYFGVTKGQLAYQASKMGLQMKVKRTHWTPEDDAQLKRFSAKYNISNIARKMNKSIQDIYCRRAILGIIYPNREWYSASEVRRILGCGDSVLKRYIANKELRAMQLSDEKGYRWKIYRKHLRDFIRTYPDTLTGHNIDIIEVVSICCGLNYKGVS